MRYPFALVLALLLLTGCTEQSTAPVPTNTVTLTFVEAEGQEARLLLSNGTDQPVMYLGWTENNPLTMVEVHTDTGWCTVAWDWCATGAVRYRIEPLASVMVTAPVMRRNLPTRVSFGFTQSEEGDYHTLFSNEFVVPE